MSMHFVCSYKKVGAKNEGKNHIRRGGGRKKRKTLAFDLNEQKKLINLIRNTQHGNTLWNWIIHRIELISMTGTTCDLEKKKKIGWNWGNGNIRVYTKMRVCIWARRVWLSIFVRWSGKITYYSPNHYEILSCNHFLLVSSLFLDFWTMW